MGVITHQLWSRISARFCVQPVYTTVSACIHWHMAVIHAPAAYSDVVPTNSYSLYKRCMHSMKIVLMVHMWPMAIVLNYSVEKHTEWRRPDTYIYIYEKAQPNSLVWSSFTLAPISKIDLSKSSLTILHTVFAHTVKCTFSCRWCQKEETDCDHKNALQRVKILVTVTDRNTKKLNSQQVLAFTLPQV